MKKIHLKTHEMTYCLAKIYMFQGSTLTEAKKQFSSLDTLEEPKSSCQKGLQNRMSLYP